MIFQKKTTMILEMLHSSNIFNNFSSFCMSYFHQFYHPVTYWQWKKKSNKWYLNIFSTDDLFKFILQKIHFILSFLLFVHIQSYSIYFYYIWVYKSNAWAVQKWKKKLKIIECISYHCNLYLSKKILLRGRSFIM